ncbi:MAG: Eco57I restriction-modification methylase domain-containing protein, partial [Terriglobia bacterium]
MKYPSIRIEGAILSADILDKIEQGEIPGQKPSDFGFDSSFKVKDEIVRAWTDAQDYWRIFRRKLESLKTEATATSETRNLWMVPLLGLLGYELELSGRGEVVNAKNYAISHRMQGRDNLAVHIMGYRDSLDRKRVDSGPRMSPHALVQEYLNLTEHL